MVSLEMDGIAKAIEMVGSSLQSKKTLEEG
jgi:hypothetical protein